MTNLNSRYFETIDTAEKAYWLGFLYADGCLKKNSTLQLCLSTKDESLVFKFIQTLNDPNPNVKYYGPYKTSGKQIHYYLKNEKIYKDLIRWGCTPKKSTTIRLPKLSSKVFFDSFLLGYYDGDGCVGSPVIVSGSDSFLSDIKKYFKIKQKIRLVKNPHGSVYSLNIGISLFCQIIKQKIGLERKRFIRNRKTELGKIRDYKTPKKLDLDILELELKKGLSYQQVAKNLKVHRNTVYRARRKINQD